MRVRILRAVLAAFTLAFGLPAGVRAQVQPLVIHTFNGADGVQPQGGPARARDGRLYGVTNAGGAWGLGTVYRIGEDGFEVLHAFSGTSGDGGNPVLGRLVEDANGTLYGTTELGGVGGLGAVFKLTTGSVPQLTIIHSFDGTNGSKPRGGVILGGDGALYGSTSEGGATNQGTVFKINPDGSLFQKLHEFSGTDGSTPHCTLLEASDGLLYGTTTEGGPSDSGTIFRIRKNGTDFSTVYAFAYVNQPGDVRAVWGVVEGPSPEQDLFGATLEGGGSITPSGRVFRVRKDGTGFQTLHSFAQGDPGGYWLAGPLLLASDGRFYGTTAYEIGCPSCVPQGGLFSITPAGVFTAVYVFTGLSDGASPLGGLTQDGSGALLGATYEGTVFTLQLLAPPPPSTPVPQLTGTDFASAGTSASASYVLTLRNPTTATAPGPFTVKVKPSPGLTFSVESGGWSCGPDPGDPLARSCTWSGPLAPGATSPEQAMWFDVDLGPYASDCGPGPSPCVSVRASLEGTAEATTAYTGVQNVGGNNIPQARDHDLWVYNSRVAFNPLYNAYEPDGDAMTVTIDTPPGRGIATIALDGKLTYTPFAESTDPDSFRYRVRDSRGASVSAVVRINSGQPTLTGSKTLIDVGPIATGRLAAGWTTLTSSAFGLTVDVAFEDPTPAEIATALAGTPYESLGAVADRDAFRPLLGGMWLNNMAYGPNTSPYVVFRPTAGRVSATKAVFTSYYSTVAYPGIIKATTSAIVVGMSSPPGVMPVTAVDDSASTPVNTPVTIQWLANDTVLSGRPIGNKAYLAYDLDATLFHGDTTMVQGSVNSGSQSFSPFAGFAGTTRFTYGIAEEPCPWPTPCSTDYNLYFATVTVTVGGPSSPPAAFGKSAPANGATNAGSSPTLTWGASAGATGYQVCVDQSNDNACGATWVSAGAATSSALSGLAPGTYYWQARAQNTSGTTEADGGAWWAFTVSGPVSGPPWTMTITPPTGGAIQGAGLNCGGGGTACSVAMPAAMTLGLSATASAGYTFTSWTGDCVGTSAGIFINLAGPRTCGAVFTPAGGGGTPSYALTIAPVPAGGSVSGAGLACGNGGATCSATVASGTTVTLTATPASGYVFTNWGGACSGTSATTTVLVDAAKTCSATFTSSGGPVSGPPWTMTITPPTGGTIQGAGLNCGVGGTVCSVTMPAAMTLGLSATASAGYTFTNWTGDCAGTSAGIFVNLAGPRTCSAVFTPK